MNQDLFKNALSPSRVKNMMELAAKLRPDIPAEYWSRLGQVMTSDKYLEGMGALMVPIIQRHFCTDDIKQYNAFYGSPAGRKFHAEIPVVMDEWGKAAEDYAATLFTVRGVSGQPSTAGGSGKPPAPSTPASAKCAPPTDAEVREWLGMRQEMIKEIWSSKVKQTMEYMPKLHPEISSEQRARLEQTLMSDKAREGMFAQMAPVVQRHFCAEDIQQYIAFNNSPAGRKFDTEMRAVSVEWFQSANGYAASLAAEGVPK